MIRRLARLALWPVRRVLDPRFDDTHRRLEYSREALDTAVRLHGDRVAQIVAERIDDHAAAHRESLAFVGAGLQDVAAAEGRMNAALEVLEHEVAAARSDLSGAVFIARVRAAIAAGADGLDEDVSELVNFALSHHGFSAQRELWFNPPVSLEHKRGDVVVDAVNERIVEVPFAFRSLAGLEPGSSVLDVGSSESTISLSLASLGYQVTALDPREYPLSHPNLNGLAARLQDWEPEGSFDALLLISTLEHVGLGFYGEEGDVEDADREALERLGSWLAPGGRLVLTVPYATTARTTDKERIYDAARLDALLEGWVVDERIAVSQTGARTWEPGEPKPGQTAVAMVLARRP